MAAQTSTPASEKQLAYIASLKQTCRLVDIPHSRIRQEDAELPQHLVAVAEQQRNTLNHFRNTAAALLLLTPKGSAEASAQIDFLRGDTLDTTYYRNHPKWFAWAKQVVAQATGHQGERLVVRHDWTPATWLDYVRTTLNAARAAVAQEQQA
jgi:hypothetical protein